MKTRRSPEKRLTIPDEVVSLIRGAHPQLKQKIKAALECILEEPTRGKSLRDELQGLRSYRVGRFRIIYRESSKNLIQIVAIGPRQVIYEETYRIVRKK